MNNFNTKLIENLMKGNDVREIFRNELEKAINKILELELTAHLDYEKHDVKGYNTGNSRNGSYDRKLYSEYGS